ncbi:glycoside hydrolase family 125 protein [Lactococcus petauri]|uniref:glycoside hydrolase family 125 protein n=1 Tax=Lactococcus petauri TaxID=1940789 RepID=UPI003852F954
MVIPPAIFFYYSTLFDSRFKTLQQNHPLYTKTREKCLSEENPYYYVGQYLHGIGSPHTPPRYVWPIALAMEGLITNDIDKMKKQIETIVATDGGTGQCHEGIDVDNPNNYTREWFSWSNMTYCQLVFRYLNFSQNK